VGEFTVLGSGDLSTATDVKRMLDETGVDGVTVARGAIGNPFIFRECRALLAGDPLPTPPSLEEQRQAMMEHLALAIEHYGPERAGLEMRKFLFRYAERHPQGLQVRQGFVNVTDPSECEALISQFYR
jgi:tRNA-dihydrouridine synthase